MSRIVPAEWAPHRAMWLGWPSHADLWAEDLAEARAEVAALARALAGPGEERVRLLVHGGEAEAAAHAALDGAGVEIVTGRFGDIWLRDTGPIFTREAGADVAVAFRFNGWGGKYELPHDDEVASQIASAAGVALSQSEAVMEGGALEHDGFGTVLTTRQCLLNPNRNTDWVEGDAERVLEGALGAKKVLWLGDGLKNDHTDGHVDNLARFVAPGVVACPMAWGEKDPNGGLYGETARMLSEMTDARGERLKVVRIPSPGRIVNEDGDVVPASHMNFIIANAAVIVPTYGDAQASRLAVEAVQAAIPERQVIGLKSTAILTGGGSFHCITQQEPA
jgi:agmatine deiminase